MDEATREKYRERGIGGLQTSGRRPCLAVVDLTYGFTDREGALGCDAGAAVAATRELLDVARANDIPRVFTRIAYSDADRRVAAAFLEKIPALGELTPASRGSRINDAIAPEPGEPVLTKLFASAFFGTPLASLLAAHGSDTVVIAGASTSGCVRATAVDALQHGYRVVVPRAAVADRAQMPHEAALFDIQAKYGEVVELEDALALLRGDPEEVRA